VSLLTGVNIYPRAIFEGTAKNKGLKRVCTGRGWHICVGIEIYDAEYNSKADCPYQRINRYKMQAGIKCTARLYTGISYVRQVATHRSVGRGEGGGRPGRLPGAQAGGGGAGARGGGARGVDRGMMEGWWWGGGWWVACGKNVKSY
jgi:hypothetical protein